MPDSLRARRCTVLLGPYPRQHGVGIRFYFDPDISHTQQEILERQTDQTLAAST